MIYSQPLRIYTYILFAVRKVFFKKFQSGKKIHTSNRHVLTLEISRSANE